MTHTLRSRTRGLLVGVLLIALPGDAAAQSPFDGWRQPVVVEWSWSAERTAHGPAR